MERFKLNNPFKAPCFYKKTTASTMEDAKSLSAENLQHGAVVMAGHQSQGRGRIPGRIWLARPDENLLFTICLKKSRLMEKSAVLPLLLGLAVSRTLDSFYGIHCGLKWPNDVFIGGRKCAGILCESGREWVFAGLGINCNQSFFPKELEERACSLRQVLKRDVKLLPLLQGLLEGVQESLRESNWKSAVEKRLLGWNRPVTVALGHPEAHHLLQGVLTGIGTQGELLVRDAKTERIVRVASGEILLT